MFKRTEKDLEGSQPNLKVVTLRKGAETLLRKGDFM